MKFRLPIPFLRGLPLFSILLLCVVVLGPVVNYGYIYYDDDKHVIENPLVRDLTGPGIVRMFTRFSVSSYYPVRLLSLALDYRFGGTDPRGYHLTNLLLHFFNIALLYYLSLRLFRRKNPAPHAYGPTVGAFVTAVLFAIHPVVVEPVTWISGREELLMTCFALVAFHAYLSSLDSTVSPRRRAMLYAAVLLCGTAACMSNVLGALLPFLFLAHGVCLGGEKRRVKDTLVRTALLWPVAAAAIWLKLLDPAVAHVDVAGITAQDMPNALRIQTVLHVYAQNLQTLFFPHNLLTPYLNVVPRGWSQPSVLFGLAAVILTGGLIVAMRGHRTVLFGLLWFLVALAPSSSVVPHHLLRADRFLYLPLAGLALALGRAAAQLRRSRTRPLVWLAVIVLLPALTTQAIRQRRHWRNSSDLWAYILAVDPSHYIAHTQLATELLDAGRQEEALHHLQTALRDKPDYGKAHYNLGCVLAARGHLDDAIRHYSEALRTHPHDPDFHNNLGIAFSRRGDHADALRHYSDAIRLDPNHPDAYVNLGADLIMRGRYEEALEPAQRSIALTPDSPSAHLNLAAALERLGRREEALAHLSIVLDLTPQDIGAQESYNRILSVGGRGRGR